MVKGHAQDHLELDGDGIRNKISQLLIAKSIKEASVLVMLN